MAIRPLLDEFPSLKSIAINAIARHSHWFQSFGGLPQQLAEEVIRAAFDKDRITAEMMADFAESYSTANLSGLTHMKYARPNTLKGSHRWKLAMAVPDSVCYLDRQLQTLSFMPSFITKMDLSGCEELIDDEMPRLNQFVNLITLNISGTNVSDYGVAQLANPFALKAASGLWKLRALIISDVPYVTDASLKYMPKFPALELIDLSYCSVIEHVAVTVFAKMGFHPAERRDSSIQDLVNVCPHQSMAAYLLQTEEVGPDRQLYWAAHSGVHIRRDQVIQWLIHEKIFKISKMTFVKDPHTTPVEIRRKRPAINEASGPLKIRKPVSQASDDILRDLFRN